MNGWNGDGYPCLYIMFDRQVIYYGIHRIALCCVVYSVVEIYLGEDIRKDI